MEPCKTLKELQKRYGKNDKFTLDVNINPENVPEKFRYLIPYVQYLAFADDNKRKEFIEKSKREDMEELMKIILPVFRDIVLWTSGDTSSIGSKYNDVEEASAFEYITDAYFDIEEIHDIYLDEPDDASYDDDAELDPANVPENLRALIPLAEKFGMGDEDELEMLVEQASEEERRQLKEAVEKYDKELDDWLLNPKDEEPGEFYAFVCMSMAAEMC